MGHRLCSLKNFWCSRRKYLEGIFYKILITNWGTGQKCEVRRTPWKEGIENRNSRFLGSKSRQKLGARYQFLNNACPQMWTVSLCGKDSKCTKKPTRLKHEFFLNNKETQRKCKIGQIIKEEIKIYSINIKVQKSKRSRPTKILKYISKTMLRK